VQRRGWEAQGSAFCLLKIWLQLEILISQLVINVLCQSTIELIFEQLPRILATTCSPDCKIFPIFRPKLHFFAIISRKCRSYTPKTLFINSIFQIQRPEVVVVLQRRNALCFPSWNRNFEWRGAWWRWDRCRAPASRKWRRKWRRCTLKWLINSQKVAL